jgi:hypothetical protein
MLSSGMLCRVVLVGTDISEERSISITRVTRIDEAETTLAAISNRNALRRMLRLVINANVVLSKLFFVTLMMEVM